MSDGRLTGAALRDANFLTPEAASGLIGMDAHQFLKHALDGEITLHNVAMNIAYPAERWMITAYLNRLSDGRAQQLYLRVEEGELERFVHALHGATDIPKTPRKTKTETAKKYEQWQVRLIKLAKDHRGKNHTQLCRLLAKETGASFSNIRRNTRKP